jgi:CubicO group peptidase (beta-lactamase class C family)
MNKKCFWSMMAAPCLVLAAGLCRPAITARAQARENPAEDWQAFFDRAIPEQLESFHIAGAVVSIVEGDKVAFTKGYGFADVENGTAADPRETLFRIGSTTKLFTWTAVMQLVERGQLDLDADVNGYLDFRIPDTFSQPVTLRHLMTHTAGFEDRVTGYLAASGKDLIPLGKWLASHIPARVRAPGLYSSYSNYGAGLAGYIVERVSGLPYEEYVAKNIFAPLGMERTSLSQPLPQGWAGKLSKGYVFDGVGYQSMDFECIVPAPTGSATSTAADMARFMGALLNGGATDRGRILEPQTVETMFTRIFGHDPRLNGWAYGLYEMSRNGVRVLGHAGDTRLFHSLAALIPEKNLGIFVVYNSENAFDVQTLLLKELMDSFFPAATAPAPKITLSAEELSKFAGSYRQNRRFAETTVEKAATLLEPITIVPAGDGALLVSSAWYGEIRFVPVEPMVFAQEGDPQSILIFQADGSGEIRRVFIQDDPTTVLEKLPWYGDFSLHYAILIVAVLLFVSVLGLAFARWILGLIRKPVNAEPRPAVIGRRVFSLLSLIGIFFPVGFIFAFGGIAYGDLTLLTAVLALPVILIALMLVAAGFLIRAWKETYWRIVERIYFTVVLAASAAYLWSLNYWNLIGWKY